MIGVTGAQLHRYEMGSTRMAPARVEAVAVALGVHAESLVVNSRGALWDLPQCFPHMGSGDELLALIEVFARITDPKNRTAVVAIARILASPAAPEPEGE